MLQEPGTRNQETVGKDASNARRAGRVSVPLVPHSWFLVPILGLLVTIVLSGCADSTSENPSGQERSEKALSDPMNYSPGLGTMDRGKKQPEKPKEENGLMKDLNTVFNP